MQWAQGQTIEWESTQPLPWQGDDQFFTKLSQLIAYDATAVALVDHTGTPADQLLCARGWSPQQLGQWLTNDAHRDELIRGARRRGWITVHNQSPGPQSPLRQFAHAMVRLQPVDGQGRRRWCLLLARNAGAFSQIEVHKAGLLLRAWQASFDCPGEPDMGRLLIGHDDRLILADPMTEMLMLHDAGRLKKLLSEFHPVVSQRWPNLVDRQSHDFMLLVDDAVRWVRFHRNRVLESPEAEHWYLELRRVPDHDVPAVGLVDDKRVAVSLAYMDDHFGQTPSLARVSDVAHVSPFHFHRMFSTAVGMSPKRYVRRRQLHMAKWMLRATRLPIGSIAKSAGFASHGHFTSTFRRLAKVSPSQYRDGKG